ncbi:MAG: hypothetical protein HY027_12675 [Deltaproteobacteria bacterium]|nr:hypothetical protein [Deltaproteobacteria bacterium]
MTTTDHRQHRSSERGSALIATLGTTAAILPLAAMIALVARASFYMHHNTRTQSEVFYAAEAGLEYAVSELTPAMTFDQLLNGPDGHDGTTDDGEFPFRAGAPAFFPRAPLRYQVRVERVNSTLLRLTSGADGVRNAHATIEGLIGRDAVPYVPAAIYADGVGSIAVGSDVTVSGFDHAAGDPPDLPTGSGVALPGLGVGSADGATAAQSQLSPAERARLVGAGGAPSVSEADPIDVRTVADALATLAAVSTSSGALSGGVQLGTVAAPQITVVTDAGDIAGPVTGAGVLIAPAGLHIAGDFTFHGLVLADGGIVFGNDSHVAITGSLWLGGSSGTLNLAGTSSISYSRSDIGAVDQHWVGRLPHPLVLKGWREVL